VIDLHLHTTASDGWLPPTGLVERVVAAGITVMSVTDHDTVAGLAEARRAASLSTVPVEIIDGIEITAVHDGRDVHILGYFLDIRSVALEKFLRAQRASRVERVFEIGERLTALGASVDIEDLMDTVAARPGTSIGRPSIARALVEAGHAAAFQDAFDRYLASGRPAFVPRRGQSPRQVIDAIHMAGGLASMAHPGVTRQPALLASLVDAGLDGIEVYHSDHPPAVRAELAVFAARHRLLVTGGSDYHGDDGRDRPLGGVTLPAADFARLRDAAERRRPS
jgi:predicted metal-dependent phosphoesterase TrpH